MDGGGDVLNQAPVDNPLNVDQAPSQSGTTLAPAVVNRTATLGALAQQPIGNQPMGIPASAGLGQSADFIKQYIQSNGDMQVRMDAAGQWQQQQQKAALEAYQNAPKYNDADTVRQGAATLLNNINTVDTQQRAQSALEEQAVQKIQDLAYTGNYTQAKMLVQNLRFPDVESVIRDTNTKQLILQNAIDNARVADQDQPWFSHLASFVLGFLPLYQSGAQSDNVPVEAAAKHWYDAVLSGQRLQSESASLWNMNSDDFAQFVNQKLVPQIQRQSMDFGFYDQDKALNILTKLQRPAPAWETNAGDALQNLGWVPVTKVFSGAKMLVGLGARAEATNLFAQAAQELAQGATETTLGMTQPEVEAALSHDAINPESVFKTDTKMPDGTTGSEVGVAGGANDALNKGKQIFDNLTVNQNAQPIRLSSEELADAAKKNLDRLGVTDRTGQNINLVPQTTEAGSKVYHVQADFGTRTDTGFSSDRAARGFITSNGYTVGQNAWVVKDTSGQFFARLQAPIDEAGLYSKPLDTATGANPVSRIFLGARQLVGDFMFGEGQLAANARASMLRQFETNVKPTFGKLSPDESNAVRQLLTYQTQQGRWLPQYEIDQLYQSAMKRAPSEGELRAIQAYRDTQDLAYFMRNNMKYVEEVTKGKQTVGIPDTGIGPVQPQNAIVQGEFGPQDERVFNVTDQTHYTDDNPLTQVEADRLTGTGHKLVTLDDPVQLADDTYVRKFIVRGGDMKIEPLKTEQVPYSEGGTRVYADKYFVKQALWAAQRDTGERILLNPKTYITAASKDQAQQWADGMEMARNAFNDGKDASTIDDILRQWDTGKAGSPRLPSGQDFYDMMKSGDLEHATPFEALYDRQLPRDYLDNRVNKSFVSEDQSGAAQIERMKGLYYGPKGDMLSDWQGNFSKLIDPYKALNDSLMNIANMSSFNDFKTGMINRWNNTYSQFLAEDTGNPMSNFMNGEFMSTKSDDRLPGIVGSGQAQRDVIKRVLGWKTPGDLYQEQLGRRFAEWVDTSDFSNAVLPQNARNAISEGLTDWATNNSSAVKALKGLAFDMKIGMFNVGRFPLHLGLMAAATMADPLNGFKGMMTLMPLRAYLTKAGTDDMLNLLVDRGIVDSAGFGSAEEFKDFMNSAKYNGFFNSQEMAHDLTGYNGPVSVTNQTMNAINDVRSAGRFFYNEAELWNKAVAWRIAWEQTRDALPKLTTDNPEFQRMLADKAELFAGQMSSNSQAAWQRGIWSIPTQFWSYGARMMELMFGKGLTPAQRTRLIVGQSLFYGSASIPFVSFASDMMKQNNLNQAGDNGPDQKNPLDTLYGAMDRGLLDEAVYRLTGTDAQFGKRYGAGDWLNGFVRDVFNMSEYGQQKSAADIFGGAMGSNLVSMWKPLINVAKYAAMEAGGDPGYETLTRDNLMRLAEQVSGASSIIKALILKRYGELQSNTGTVVDTDLPTSGAWAVALGFQPGASDQAAQMQSFLSNKRQAVDDAARIIRSYRMRALSEPENMDTYGDAVNAFVKLLPRDVAVQALQRVNRLTPDSMMDQTANRIRKEQNMMYSYDQMGGQQQ